MVPLGMWGYTGTGSNTGAGSSSSRKPLSTAQQAAQRILALPPVHYPPNPPLSPARKICYLYRLANQWSPSLFHVDFTVACRDLQTSKRAGRRTQQREEKSMAGAPNVPCDPQTYHPWQGRGSVVPESNEGGSAIHVIYV